MNTITLDINEIIDNNHSHDGCGAYHAMLGQIMPIFLHALLLKTKGNKTQASLRAGFERGTLNRKLNYYGISVEQVIKCRGGVS